MARLVNNTIKNALKEEIVILAKNTCQCTHRGHSKEGFQCKNPVTLNSQFIANDTAGWYSSDNVIVVCDDCYKGGHAGDLGLPTQYTIPPR